MKLLRGLLLTAALCCVLLSVASPLRAASFLQLVDPNPASGNQCGYVVVPLSTGNVVVTAPYDDAGGVDAGAVYLFNGATGALISTLRGSTVGDNVGITVKALANGNFLIRSPVWDNGAIANAGAVTWGSGTLGVSGTVSAANSLVGSTASDQIGNHILALSNGNYVVVSLSWDNGATANVGAVTWCSGTVATTGVLSAGNSLIGSTAGDAIGTF